jgi:hypothetical protein
VPGAFSSGRTANLSPPPSYDRAWLEALTLPEPPPVTGCNGARCPCPFPGCPDLGGTFTYVARLRNCGSTTWNGQYCANAGLESWLASVGSSCAGSVAPGAHFDASATFTYNLSGIWKVVFNFAKGFSVLATDRNLFGGDHWVNIPYRWTQTVMAQPPAANTGFTAWAGVRGSWWSSMAWDPASQRYANGDGWIGVASDGTMTMNPIQHGVRIGFQRPVHGCYRLDSLTASDAEHRTAEGDDGVWVWVDDAVAYGGLLTVFDGPVRNNTTFSTASWPAGSCIPVDAAQPIGTIWVNSRGDNHKDKTYVQFQISGWDR